MSQHTLAIFRHLYENLPPLFPSDTAQEIRDSLESFEQAEDVVLADLEETMIKFGYHVWPYHQAHKEFIARAEIKLGDHFLLPYLSERTQARYNEFKDYGGDWRELYSGRPAGFFNYDERAELSRALVEAKNKLKEYVEGNIKGVSREEYLDRVEKYHQILADMEVELEGLKKLAEQERDHSALAAQISAKVEDIEHSLCLLGKELRYHELYNAKDFFIGRREELARLKGIDTPKEIDFYN